MPFGTRRPMALFSAPLLLWTMMQLLCTAAAASSLSSFASCNICSVGGAMTRPHKRVYLPRATYGMDTCQDLQAVAGLFAADSDTCRGLQLYGTTCGCPKPLDGCRICGRRPSTVPQQQQQQHVLQDLEQPNTLVNVSEVLFLMRQPDNANQVDENNSNNNPNTNRVAAAISFLSSSLQLLAPSPITTATHYQYTSPTGTGTTADDGNYENGIDTSVLLSCEFVDALWGGLQDSDLCDVTVPFLQQHCGGCREPYVTPNDYELEILGTCVTDTECNNNNGDYSTDSPDKLVSALGVDKTCAEWNSLAQLTPPFSSECGTMRRVLQTHCGCGKTVSASGEGSSIPSNGANPHEQHKDVCQLCPPQQQLRHQTMLLGQTSPSLFAVRDETTCGNLELFAAGLDATGTGCAAAQGYVQDCGGCVPMSVGTGGSDSSSPDPSSTSDGSTEPLPCSFCPYGETVPLPLKEVPHFTDGTDDTSDTTCGFLQHVVTTQSIPQGSARCEALHEYSSLCGCRVAETACRLCPNEPDQAVPLPNQIFGVSSFSSLWGWPSSSTDSDETCAVIDSRLASRHLEGSDTCFEYQARGGAACGCRNRRLSWVVLWRRLACVVSLVVSVHCVVSYCIVSYCVSGTSLHNDTPTNECKHHSLSP